MKTKSLIIAMFMITNIAMKAQYVTIPNGNFVTWLQTNYPTCMTGNLMDTTCANITSALSINISYQHIWDLTGIRYFKGLTTLYCHYDSLTSLPSLPANLQNLYCTYNSFTSLTSLPANLINLDCSHNYLISLPTLPANLINLNCEVNQLTSLPTLPVNLQNLNCHLNQLTSFPSLPANLQTLYCQINQIPSLTTLPASLQIFECYNNLITTIPNLPANLINLYCNSNLLTSLPSLPPNLQNLDCSFNQLTSLPSLPNNLQTLSCFNNQLTSIPNLPTSLNTLYCYYNQLTNLPSLPANLQSLICRHNQLTSLPSLPPNIQTLSCRNNLLTSLPSLPTNLQTLRCDSNNIACFPVFPNSILFGPTNFNIKVNPFTCLPNYVAAMDAGTLAYPLCVNGNTIINPSGCSSAEGIVGYVYKDNNNDCIKNTGDLTLNNININLYDSINNLLAQTNSFSNGIYNFAASSGTYTVKIDTAGMPFTMQCVYPGIDSTVVLSTANPLAQNVNFNITCKPGFDIGTQAVVPRGLGFPGQTHTLTIVAGDMGNWYNLNCASGVSGQVTFTITGPVAYSGSVSGALIPTVTGNVFTYAIADFGTINNQTAFRLLFTTNTTAQVGDVICATIAVTPIAGDDNPNNNTYQFCYLVKNSYDPNMKEVYPVNVLPGYQDWFTYTIHFQNTGTAPAANIRLLDTLSTNLDLSTFQVINYSHPNTVTLNNNNLTFRFPNIMLPDSNSNREASKGFIQYRIKPKANLPLGTQIKNTAYIYFDYNTPIITNTTLNEYTATASIFSNLQSSISNLILYPNPAKSVITVKSSIEGTLKIDYEVLDVLGKTVIKNDTNSSNFSIAISDLSPGIYFIRLNINNSMLVKKFVKE